MRMQTIEHLTACVKNQQSQITQLCRRQAQLREEAEVLRECLEASGALAPIRFLASLHRRRFVDVVHRHPGEWPGSLDAVIQIRELALATTAHAGVASVSHLAGASRAMRGGVGTMISELPALFPSQVYAIGGADDGANALGSVERFDSARCAWEPVGPLSEPRESCAAVAANNMIFVLGGVNEAQCLNTVERFSPKTNRWDRVASMQCARSSLSAVAVAGQVYALGGRDGFQSSLDSVERFDVIALRGRWELQPQLRSGRFGTAAAVLGGRIYVVGGKDGSGVLDAVERYEPELGLWEVLPSLHARRYRAAAAAAHGRVYVVGGCDGSWQTGLRSVERYDPETSAWSILAPLQVPRWGAAAVPAGCSICVLGGRHGGGALTSVERLDPATGTWEPLPPLQGPRKFLGAAACRG